MAGMSTSSIPNLSSSYLQSILGTGLQNTGITSQANTASALQQEDMGQLSPFLQIMNTLQQLQQSNPTQYQQVTQQIASNLQTAAQTAQTDGNTAAANQLNQLSADFKSASQNGQLPNIGDLAKAIGGHHHHGGHHHFSALSSNDSSADSSSNSSPLSQILSAFQTNQSQNDALNPLSIIENTLSSAGITSS